MTDKRLEQITKALGKETVEEMKSQSSEMLKAVIVEANSAMEQVAAELEANAKYQELKESLSALTQGKKEVNKRQKAKIAYALHLLES